MKPIENFHVAFSLRNLADEPARAVEFLQSEGVEHLRLINPYIADRTLEMLASEDKLAQRLRQLRIGFYTVSGSTSTLGLVADHWGLDIARSRLEEMWLNAMAAAGDRCGPIVDRNATAYLTKELPYVGAHT